MNANFTEENKGHQDQNLLNLPFLRCLLFVIVDSRQLASFAGNKKAAEYPGFRGFSFCEL